ncbi:hypothetical protein NEF87_002854 [Candidatus Lokiarchaeum ossiferum]|uniref:Inosine monophosphate cyclohydrolase-like domain-containing protein n=1 Tax=Candidatus Lokiarchaeum ossiferum TaxID=2951803 RepID=A0ABY6HST6_9ARCH|nr:hypothetical protein NEF87_002854 [Candidatus Lokiarchaeum sp. B-35]
MSFPEQHIFNENPITNLKSLKANAYSGRGLIIGRSPNGQSLIQIYWIGGRSVNSQNRVFYQDEQNFVRTKAFDESKLTDPSLIIYFPIKHLQDWHIISNGDQTETIYEALQNGKSFEDALNMRKYEPDPPNFTPRISGIGYSSSKHVGYTLSILKSFQNKPEYALRHYYNYKKSIPGLGHAITTYKSNGNPLPSFYGEPFVVEIFDDITQNIDTFWNALNPETRVALLVKMVDLSTKNITIEIKNKN